MADGMYGNFAGRDASRGMAKQSFDEGECSSPRERSHRRPDMTNCPCGQALTRRNAHRPRQAT